MNKNLTWRIVLAVIVIGGGLIYALPSFLPAENVFQRLLPDKKVNLGLDLRGGISLTLGVDMDTAIENSLNQLGNDLRSQAREKDILILHPQVISGNRLQFLLLQEKNTPELERLIKSRFAQELFIEKSTSLQGDKKRYILSLRSEYRDKLKDLTIDQALKVIRNRINQFGVTQPDIRKMQNNRIQVQLPGLEDAERAIEIVKKTAHLEFKLVDKDADVQKAVGGNVPPGSELAYIYKTQPNSKDSKQPIVLKKEALLTGKHITDAHVAFDNFNQPYVALSFDRTGTRLFERITEEHVNQRLAIVLDNKVYSAPVIREKISGGRASISGQFTSQEAHDLAIVLRAGSLPAPVNVLQERSVGPSLGEQSINQGIQAMVVGGILVVIFAIVYYGFGGVIVNLLLGFNIVIIIGVLAGFGATLTLPGIAGIILLIGTAVDASVLIFERIREELRRGLSPTRAVDEGFSRATLTIVDANVTTIMAAIILYQFGTGPIRGFAVTLSIGTLASMFTAIFLSRIFFDLWLQRKRPGISLNL